MTPASSPPRQLGQILIAKGILSKEDIMADLARQNIDAETAFKIHALLNETPEK